jgi:hypothetical protein
MNEIEKEMSVMVEVPDKIRKIKGITVLTLWHYLIIKDL